MTSSTSSTRSQLSQGLKGQALLKSSTGRPWKRSCPLEVHRSKAFRSLTSLRIRASERIKSSKQRRLELRSSCKILTTLSASRRLKITTFQACVMMDSSSVQCQLEFFNSLTRKAAKTSQKRTLFDSSTSLTSLEPFLSRWTTSAPQWHWSSGLPRTSTTQAICSRKSSRILAAAWWRTSRCLSTPWRNKSLARLH